MRLIYLISILITCCNIFNKTIATNQNEYHNLKDSIVFTDSNSNMYILQKIDIINSNKKNNTVYRYFDLLSLRDSVYELKQIIDINTFKKVSGLMYTDTNYIYTFNPNPNISPSIIAVKK